MRPAAPVLVVALALSLHQARADLRIYVDADAPPGGDGTSWVTAFNDLQDGLAAADMAGEPAEVWVAEGVYRPDRGTLDKAASFGLLSGVAIYGGFGGSETDLTQRDPGANVTTLSGDLENNDLPGFANYGDNSEHVVTAQGVDETAVLDGFTIASGNAITDGGSFETQIGGGGLFADEASPVIVGCVFEANSAGQRIPANGFFGAAVLLRNAAQPMRPRLERCVFIGNRGVNGGALGVLALNPVGHDVRVLDCDFISNDAEVQFGGAVAAAGSGLGPPEQQTVRFERCRFEANHAVDGGAMFVQSPGGLFVIDCELVGNWADFYGSGIWHIESDDPDALPAQIVGCTFVGNFVGTSGGALVLNSARAEVIGCSFLGNYSVAGAGILVDGVNFGCGEEVAVVNSVFSANFGNAGAGVYVVCSPLVTIASSTFSVNFSGQGGAGVHVDGGSVDVAGSVLWGNVAGASQDEAAQLFHAGDEGGITLNYSLVQGLTGALGGEGNIDSDPRFADPDGADDTHGTADDDFTLLAGSPAIDAADNTRVPADAADLDGDGNEQEATPLDRAGAPRFADDPDTPDTGVAGNGHDEVVDMGAYEFGSGCVADFNADGVVDTRDVLAFLNAWASGDSSADMNGDDQIDTRDVIAFLNFWTAGC